MNSKKIKITNINSNKGVFPFSEIGNKPIKVIRVSNESIARCNKTIEPLINENRKVLQKSIQGSREHRIG